MNKDQQKTVNEKPELEQEPVAWMYDWNIKGEGEYGETRYDCLIRAEAITNKRAITNIRPLYTAPPKREPLSDDRKLKLIREWPESKTMRTQDLIGLCDLIEKSHGIGE